MLTVLPETLASLTALTQRLFSTPPLDPEEARRRNKAHVRDVTARMLSTGQTFGQASGRLAHLNQDEASFRAYMKRIADDLGEQVRIAQEAVEGWFECGESAPPHYARRIAIVLRKAGRLEDELAFIEAYALHFGDVFDRRAERPRRS